MVNREDWRVAGRSGQVIEEGLAVGKGRTASRGEWAVGRGGEQALSGGWGDGGVAGEMFTGALRSRDPWKQSRVPVTL